MPAKRTSKPAPEVTTVKRGFLSKDNKLFIERNAGKMTAEHMAMVLRRPPVQVERYLAQVSEAQVAMKVSQNLTSELEDRPEWAEFRRQYDEEELKFLKYRYVQFMNQFGKDDVLPTEELQIFTLIQLEITANQAMRERKTLVIRQKAIQAVLEEIYAAAATHRPGSGDAKRLKAEARELEAEFLEVASALKGLNSRQESHMTQSTKVLADLKGTRDQRVKVIEGSRASFLGFLKALTQEDFRNQQGREMEMMRAAMEKEQVKMGGMHEYIDGMRDQPLLTPETVLAEGAE